MSFWLSPNSCSTRVWRSFRTTGAVCSVRSVSLGFLFWFFVRPLAREPGGSAGRANVGTL
eukprot:563382-Amphidinium_carterae.1